MFKKITIVLVATIWILTLCWPLPYVFGKPDELHVGSGYTYSSIQEAIDAASPGDIIIVHVGIYNEGIVIDKECLTIIGEDGVVLDGTGQNVHYGIHITANNVTVRNLKVVKFTYGWGWGVQLTGADYCLLENLIVEECNSGINLYRGSDYNIVQNCEVIGIGGNGISIYGSDVGCTHNQIRNNRIIDCAWYMPDGKYHLPAMPIFSAANCNVIENNLLEGTGVGYGILLWGYTYGKDDAPEAGNIIRNNEISSFYKGIYVYGYNPKTGSLNLVLDTIIEKNDIKNNTIGIEQKGFSGSAYVTARYNWFSGNKEYGAFVNTTYGIATLDARYNYWGDPSGPYHPTLNPDGKGDRVSDHVDFKPWQTRPWKAPVGGIWIPVNTFELLLPLMKVTSLITIMAVAASIVYVKRIKKKQR